MTKQRWVIGATWEGTPLEQAELTTLEVELGQVLRIYVDAPFHADPAPASPPGRAERLWEHEVVELFLAEAPTRAARYLELELGPYGHWLALGFEGYRRCVCDDLGVRFRARIEGARWSGVAEVDGAEIERVIAIARVGAANAYAICGSGSTRRYFAAHPVPAGRYAAPDFHRLEYFGPGSE